MGYVLVRVRPDLLSSPESVLRSKHQSTCNANSIECEYDWMRKLYNQRRLRSWITPVLIHAMITKGIILLESEHTVSAPDEALDYCDVFGMSFQNRLSWSWKLQVPKGCCAINSAVLRILPAELSCRTLKHHIPISRQRQMASQV